VKLKKQFVQLVQIQVPEDQFTLQVHQVPQRRPNEVLPTNHAIQIKAAEYWLKLGDADQALKELEALPSRIWKCGWALKTRIAAIGVLRQRNTAAVLNRSTL
jgi:thioredoxin-like negative regulator of GroEL